MNFRELIMRRILSLLNNLLVEPDQVTENSRTGVSTIRPNANYRGVLQTINIGSIENPGSVNDPAPVAFVGFDGGRNDLGIDTFVTHIVEVLSINIIIILNEKIGVKDSLDTTEVRPIEFQASDLVSDIQKLITQASLASALHVSEVNTSVNEVILEEWGFNEEFRGGPLEVLEMTFQAEITNPRTT